MIYCSSHADNDINIETDRANPGSTAAPLPPASPVREPAAPRGRGAAGRVRRGRGPQPLSAILPAVLESLGGEAARLIQSTPSGETP
jgi:hypothetical protein